MLIVFLLLFSPIVHCYTDDAINLLVRSTTTVDTNRYCTELAKLPNNVAVNITNFGWYSPYLASTSVDACNISTIKNSLPGSFPSNTILILYEHQCTMTEQSWNIENHFGQHIVLMIITKRTNTRYELTYNTTTMPVTIPVVIFWEIDFIRMSNEYHNLSHIELSIDYPVIIPRKFRPAILLMFLLVLIILLCGNFWAADEFKKKIQIQDINTTSAHVLAKQNSITPSVTLQEKELAVLPMTCCFIVIMICFAVGWLLLLYFFPQVMIYILQVMFCISSFSCLTSCFSRLSYFVPLLRRYQIPSYPFRKPCVCQLGPLNLFALVVMSLSLTLVIIWYIYRRSDWAWILQDILGAAVCITVTSVYRLGNMRVITIILVVFFLYDIFFVFITPFIPFFQKSSTSSNPTAVAPSSGSSSSSTSQVISRNPSVMEQVALGIGANGEVVPLLFALPMFIPESEIDPCVTVRKSMLGFGDVILPGILLTFCKIFDEASGNHWPIYYIQSLVSYFIGLALTHVALYLMNTAQPALLYIVPCLLLSTIITSLVRRELKELYTGRRIQILLDRTTQEPIVSTRDNVDNPVRQQTGDIVAHGDNIINIDDTIDFDNH